jgi:hypothetical protein
MRNMKGPIILGRAVLALSLAVVLGYGTTPQEASAIQANASAEVVTPLTVTADETRELNFGKFAPADGSIVIEASAAGTPSGAIIPTAPTVGTIGAGRFLVTGPLAQAYDVQLPTTSGVPPTAGVQLVNQTSGGSETMEVINFATDHVNGTTVGADPDFYVGAELVVEATTVDGSYEGTYEVTIVASP